MAMDIVTSQLTPWMIALPLMFDNAAYRAVKPRTGAVEAGARTLRLRAPDSAESLSVRRSSEVRPLVEALNQLFQRTHDAMLRERRFTS